ncbi:retinoic acid-induced protein 1 [Salarias fasciatus]|uniref:Retinoic acid-induced protein 1-like n=1 Tax=Salarias fasciatus TaxID=181472 RepID=A0A672FU17_SALFA|nr:retinoic acid-induced protein 1-like [Salarias fasciatus]
MEQPPGSFDDLQPQDLSTSGLSTVIDLTRKRGEERVLNPASLDALRMVGSSGWYPVPEAADPGLPYPESASSDAALQAGDQIQPDNAFSHTTVTLSYVSRSHVFTAHDSLSHSALYSVPPISKFSLHPPCDADKGLGESGYALNQHYLVEEEGPVDLATQTELFQPPSRTQTGELLVQEPHEWNGGVVPSDGDVEMSVHGDDEDRTSLENNESLENGQGDRWSSSGVCADSSPETPAPLKEEEEVLFLLSKKRHPGADSEGVDTRNLCSLRREYISPLEDPVSPSATSLDDVEDVFVLPQASCSPSGDAPYLEDAACDGSSTEGGIQASSGINDGAVRMDSSEENKQLTRKRKTLLAPLIDLTDDACLADLSENKANTSNDVPHVNGNVKVLERTLTERKLPMRIGRGTRLEAIVMNINSSRYRVSGCVRSSKKTNASQSARSDSSLVSPKKKDSPSVVKQKGKVKASPSVKARQRKTSRTRRSNHINSDCCKTSTSDSETINNAKKSQSSPPPKSPQFTVHTRSKRVPESVPPPATPPRTSPPRPKRIVSSQPSPASTSKKSNKEPEPRARPEPSAATHEAKVSPLPQTSPKKSSVKAKSQSPSSKSPPPAKAKASRTPKRRRKKQKASRSSSSMFSPKEPEIKLRYVSYKEERRDSRLDGFSPFVRVERKQLSPSLCTVVNYPDEAQLQHKKGQQQAAGGSFVSAAVPSTSCLRLGRVSVHSQHRRSLVCCICGQAANAMDLGDLHGPYYPEGYRPNAKTPASASGLKEEEEDDSDSDSSSYSMKGRGRKRAAPPAPWAVRSGAQRKQKGALPDSHRWTGDDGADSPAAKRARSDPGSADAEDWYSPPVLPLEPCERWLHEDCGIWSAGVFLVKGKVYGLEEAVKAAQETVCSACHGPGATLGCLFKGCPNKYHYRCALESDCVLTEENFSMKCKKHKNKTFKGPPGSRWNDR